MLANTERVTHTPAVRQCEHHTRTDPERVVGTELLAASAGYVRLQVDITQLQVPAVAEAARSFAGKGVVLACELHGMPAEHGAEVGVGTQILAALGRSGDLDAGFNLGHAARIVLCHQPQPVEAIGQRGRVDAGQCACADRHVVLRQHGEVDAALARDLQAPHVEVDIEHRATDIHGAREACTGHRRVQADAGGLLVVGVLDADHRRGAAHQPVGVDRGRRDGVFAQAGRDHPAAPELVERHRRAVEAQAQPDDVREAVGDGMQ